MAKNKKANPKVAFWRCIVWRDFTMTTVNHSASPGDTWPQLPTTDGSLLERSYFRKARVSAITRC